MKIKPLIIIILAAGLTTYGQSVQSGTGTAGVTGQSQSPRSTPGDPPPGQSGEPVEPGFGVPAQTNTWQKRNVPSGTNNWQTQNTIGENATNSNELNATNNGYGNNSYGNTNWFGGNTNSSEVQTNSHHWWKWW